MGNWHRILTGLVLVVLASCTKIDVEEPSGEFAARAFCGDPCQTQQDQCCKCALVGTWSAVDCNNVTYDFSISGDQSNCISVFVSNYCNSGRDIFATFICNDPSVQLGTSNGAFSMAISDVTASPLTATFSCNAGGCLTTLATARKE